MKTLVQANCVTIPHMKNSGKDLNIFLFTFLVVLVMVESCSSSQISVIIINFIF